MCYSSSAVIAFFCFFLSLGVQAQGEDGYGYSLDGQWAFKTDLYNRGEDEEWFKTTTDTADWDVMPVPGNWDLRNEYADYAGKAWYRTTMEVPLDWKGRAVRLVFESVYNDVKVWLNGKVIGSHQAGFLPFWIDIHQHLEYGQPNILVLRADNTFKRGAIWNWGGIRRPVWLEVTGKVRLEYQHITAIPDLKHGTAEVNVNFEVSNAGDKPRAIEYELLVLRQGEVVWSGAGPNSDQQIKVGANGHTNEKVVFQLPASRVALWDFNFPNLYTCRLRLYQNDQVIHQLEDRFGIREIEVDGYALKLNGKPVRTVGFNLVAEDRVTGNTLPLWRIKEDVDLMKSLGANMARVSHLPLPEAFLDYLDEKGIMTFEEVSLWGKDAMVDPDNPLPKYWLEKMIRVKYNHPSVIGWSVGNEIGYSHSNPKARAYIKGAIRHAKQLDPNRLAVYVSHSASNQKDDPVRYADMILFNRYGNWGKEVEKVHKLHPGKPIFMAEYGNHLNNEDPNLAHIDATRMLDQLRGRPYVIGASLWTFNDYRSLWMGSENWTTPPSENRPWGIVNTFRQPKRPFYTFKREYAPVRSLTVTPSGEQPAATIALVPRNKLDLPAYVLKGYTLAWHINNRQGEILEGSFTDLPVIAPGAGTWQKDIRWQPSQKAYSLSVTLLDPQNYAVMDTTICFAPPAAPEIIKVHTSGERARVVFKKVQNATSYYLIYGKGRQSAPSIDHFIEVDSLETFTPHKFQVVALNNAGESLPSRPVTASTDEDELPPVIWATVPFRQSFFIGYSVDRLDYLYEIRYGTSPGKYMRKFGLRNAGVCQVPGLKPGETYYYQLRSHKQWGFASEWTREVEVTLKEKDLSAEIPILGVLHKKSSSLVHFEPVERAIGYEVLFKKKGSTGWQTKLVDSARLSYIQVGGLVKNKDYNFKIHAIFEKQRK